MSQKKKITFHRLTEKISLFGQIMNLFVLPDLSKLSVVLDRRIAGCGITNLLTKSDLMLQAPYVSQLWGQALMALLALLELPVPVEADGPDELYTLDIEEGGYQTSFAKLTTSNPIPEDPTTGLPVPPIFLAQQIINMPAEKRQVVKSLLSQSPEAQQFLPKYFQQANISLDQL